MPRNALVQKITYEKINALDDALLAQGRGISRKKLNSQISNIEKVESAIHTSVCKACRTYEKQSKKIDQVMDKSFDPPEKTVPGDLKETLKKEFESCERIPRCLRRGKRAQKK